MNHLPRAPTSRTRLNPHAGALPQKSTHQLRSCSWPEVHTISKVQNERFPRGVALMIASVPARSQPNRPKPIGLSRPNSHHFTFFYLLPDTFFGKNFSRAELAGAREWNMQRNDVILHGSSKFFRVSGGSVGVVGCVVRTSEHGLNSRQKACHGRLFN